MIALAVVGVGGACGDDAKDGASPSVDDGGVDGASPADATVDGGASTDGSASVDAATPSDGAFSDAVADGSSDAGPGVPIALTAAFQHTCLLTSAGAVYCWGDNIDGQLGLGSKPPYGVYAPSAAVALGAPATAISAGGYATCALLTGGAMRCWGRNNGGALGNDSGLDTTGPVDVIGMGAGVTGIGVGYDHTCAVAADASARCWGYNGKGQVGDGTKTDRYVPVPVFGLGGVTANVAGGNEHSCASLFDGGADCWGSNEYGQLGIGAKSSDAAVRPEAVSGLAGPAAVVAPGGAFTCALLTSGTVQCWGSAQWGQLGSDIGDSASPVTVPLPGPATQIAVGNAHACAVLATGALECWGYNHYGQVGSGSISIRVTSPEVVTGLGATVAAVATGDMHTCALTTTKRVLCWGQNDHGQLGRGTATPNENTPMAVTGY